MSMTEKEKKRLLARAKKLKPKPQLLPSGSWRCQVSVGGQRISVPADTPEAANAQAVAIKIGYLDCKKPAAELTVGKAIERYIESKDAVLSPSTVAGYRRIRKNALQDLMSVRLQDLTQEAVQRSVNRMAKNKSPKSVNNAHGLLSAALGMYRPDFVLRTTLPQKIKQETKVPSVEDLRKIMEQARGTKAELPVLLAVWLGLRSSEILGITWDSISGDVLHISKAVVDGEAGPVLKTTKTYSGNRKLRLPPYILQLIEAQPKTDNFVIHMTRRSMYCAFSSVCKKAGVPHYRFHDLRHGNASIMLALGVPDKYAMERMGHATNNMLKTVYQHTMAEKRQAVDRAIDDFFEKRLQE